MDGRIVSVREVEGEEGHRYRKILITIPEPPMPYQPIEWVPDWRKIQKQQSPFSETMEKEFKEYEEAMKRYDAFCDKLDAFHIGGVKIVQGEVKVRDE